MFRGFYGMMENPFEKQLREDHVYESRDFKEMTDRLNRLKDIRGIGVFTAPPGGGKTFVMRCFAKSLNPTLFQMAYICLSTVSVTEFYVQFCGALGVDASQRKATMFKNIQQRIFAMYKEKRRPLILALDEAHELDSRILKDIKMIMNQDYDSLDCFTIILLGEPHLNNILQKPVHEALRQRITIHYNFDCLSEDETENYILHKLESAGAATGIIGDGVLKAVYGYARGNPRMIDNLMTDALTLGAQQNKHVVDTDTLLAAMNNQQLG
ncbi:MAG: AAA family ATPase [Oscillospiraceae bacterium]|nr:AAA family ATPase [Oscillospiraceae bacterium]